MEGSLSVHISVVDVYPWLFKKHLEDLNLVVDRLRGVPFINVGETIEQRGSLELV